MLRFVLCVLCVLFVSVPVVSVPVVSLSFVPVPVVSVVSRKGKTKTKTRPVPVVTAGPGQGSRKGDDRIGTLGRLLSVVTNPTDEETMIRALVTLSSNARAFARAIREGRVLSQRLSLCDIVGWYEEGFTDDGKRVRAERESSGWSLYIDGRMIVSSRSLSQIQEDIAQYRAVPWKYETTETKTTKTKTKTKTKRVRATVTK